MEQVGFYFNAAACIGCKTCVIACKDKMIWKWDVIFGGSTTLRKARFPSPDVGIFLSRVIIATRLPVSAIAQPRQCISAKKTEWSWSITRCASVAATVPRHVLTKHRSLMKRLA